MFSAVGLVALAVWFPVTMLTASGISNTRTSYLDVARTLGRRPDFLSFGSRSPLPCRIFSSGSSWGSAPPFYPRGGRDGWREVRSRLVCELGPRLGGIRESLWRPGHHGRFLFHHHDCSFSNCVIAFWSGRKEQSNGSNYRQRMPGRSRPPQSGRERQARDSTRSTGELRPARWRLMMFLYRRSGRARFDRRAERVREVDPPAHDCGPDSPTSGESPSVPSRLPGPALNVGSFFRIQTFSRG